MSRKNRQRKSVVPATPSGEAISRIVEHLPGAVPAQQRVNQIISQTHFHGPLPHPDIFRQYGEIIPDAPERILRVFEDDSKHAREIQMAALVAQKADNSRVHWMAWSLIAGGYILSGLFAWLGKDTLAGILLASTLTGTIAGFFQGRPSQKKQSSEQQ
jgi:uncharacterized membrane protein